MVNVVWPIKYRPSSLENYIFQDGNAKIIIEKFIKEKDIPHLMLYGHRGTGKTTMAYILKNALEIEDRDFLVINASKDNSVDTIRSTVTSFISTHALGEFKIILFDEAEYITPNAQAILRNLMENEDYYKNCRFIFTFNNAAKIIPELKSRCQEFYFNKLDRDTVLEYSARILQKEKVKVTSIELLEKYIDLTYPDFRKLLNLLQQNVVDGKLQDPQDSITDSSVEYKVQIVELFEAGKWQAIRDVVCKNVDGDEWVELYKFFYNYLNEIGKFKDLVKWKSGIIIIADYLYRNALVADQEINFIACMIRLSEV